MSPESNFNPYPFDIQITKEGSAPTLGKVKRMTVVGFQAELPLEVCQIGYTYTAGFQVPGHTHIFDEKVMLVKMYHQYDASKGSNREGPAMVGEVKTAEIRTHLVEFHFRSLSDQGKLVLKDLEQKTKAQQSKPPK
ncbi:MAG: hypothetical protein AB7O96_06645 [Pseudobdellovibrionaceae bacterium]